MRGFIVPSATIEEEVLLIPARAGIYRDVSLLVLAVLSLSPRVREFIVLIERSMGGKVLIPARAGIYRSIYSKHTKTALSPHMRGFIGRNSRGFIVSVLIR